MRDAAWLTNGPRQLTLLVDGAATALALKPDHAQLKQYGAVGVVGAHPAGGEFDFEVRFFAASIGIDEDPVTGSLNANIAQWLIDTGRAPARYVAAQGAAMGRAYPDEYKDWKLAGGETEIRERVGAERIARMGERMFETALLPELKRRPEK